MATGPLSEMRMAVREEVIQTLKKWNDDPEVCWPVEELVASLGDTLEDKGVLEEMRGLKKSGTPFRKIFAGVADR